MEELKRQLRMELLRDLKPIFESQGIQFSSLAEMMNEEEHRSKLASTTSTPINTEVANQVAGVDDHRGSR
jgi:hypothetical protein